MQQQHTIFKELSETDFDLNKFNDLYNFLSPSNLGGERTIAICHKKNPTTPKDLLEIIGETNIIRAGENLYQKCLEKNKKTTLEYCINHQYTLAICRAHRGYLKELELLNEFKQLGFSAKFANDELDMNYAIDIVLKYNDLIIGIQLKPISYYYATDPHKTTIKQKNKLKMKRFLTYSKSKGYNALTFIVYHGKNGWLINTPETILEYSKLFNTVS